MIGTNTIRRISEALVSNLKKELRDQGHYLTGALEASMELKVTDSANKSVSEIKAYDYANDLFEGIRPEHIPQDTAYIAKMTEYAKKRFKVSGKAAIKAGVAIARAHAREGNPTQNSYNFSKTGERLFANVEAFNKHASDYDKFLEITVDAEMDQFINKTFDQTIF